MSICISFPDKIIVKFTLLLYATQARMHARTCAHTWDVIMDLANSFNPAGWTVKRVCSNFRQSSSKHMAYVRFVANSVQTKHLQSINVSSEFFVKASYSNHRATCTRWQAKSSHIVRATCEPLSHVHKMAGKIISHSAGYM